MKCPVCQAKLLPVDGEMFCLQCGTAVAPDPAGDNQGPVLEETTDPVLQRAIVDALQHQVAFRLPVSAAAPVQKTTSFATMRSILAPPRPALAGGGAAAVAVAARAPAVAVAGRFSASKEPEVAAAAPLAVGASPNAVVSGELVEPPKNGAAAINLLPVGPKVRRMHQIRRLPLAWTAGVGAFVAFMLLNIGLYSYYSARVYPGVHVAGLDLSGLPLAQVHDKLAKGLPQPTLTAEVGVAKYPLDVTGMGAANLGRAEREARALGHSTPLPLAGVLESLFSKPVAVQQLLNDATVNRLASELASELTYRPSDAVPMIVGTQPFVVAEKAGSQLEVAKAAAAIRAAYGVKPTFVLVPDKLAPIIPSSAYEDDLQEAQTKLNLSFQLRLKGKTYQPTPAQQASWFSFSGAGKGVAVDGARVADFVASVPGAFDRVAAANAILGAVSAQNNLALTLSTRKVTATPKLADTAAVLPLNNYSYCVRSGNAPDVAVLAAHAEAATAAGGWGLGESLRFTRVGDGCNFSLELIAAGQMAGVDPACAGRASCLVGNRLLVNATNWRSAPTVWAGGLDSYQTQLVSHELGHWLGFDHTSCVSPAQPGPILATPTVVVPGCSPNWYEVPAQSQGIKQLNQF